ncbi:hypothetical protein BAUCODRAFT_39186 [Baudoinia panamericana UAMH 10762]|uniref:diacylglycerol O-acyltransferase n=1 Tax=Baudoinia panamericana (strain UAMH 10762) TaxID=717646 RepID=M2MXT8_BAUPA|nr:uncharacterized protein BAUCODRAFT_39186 [Baudoinia panamericana UAMH 10762]EMC91065.1 hypothetical protein BAUCODRAFT_39186 [Baudoinia panamericana UAMH 10762]
MIANGHRFVPSSLISDDKPISIRPKSGIMSLDLGVADPFTRHSHHNEIPTTYADPALDVLERIDENDFDEDSIKETPPRPNHQRQTSEPRPLGEVMDEVERTGSPSLRHPKGRLEGKAGGFLQGIQMTPQESLSLDGVDEAKQNGVPHSPSLAAYTNGNGVAARHALGTEAPDTYEAIGEDESPRSPVRKAHKRVSSRSLNGTAKRQQLEQVDEQLESDGQTQHNEQVEQNEEVERNQLAERNGELSAITKPAATSSGGVDEQDQRPAVDQEHAAPALSLPNGADEHNQEPFLDEEHATPGQLVYENLRSSKSGTNLASIKPSANYQISLAQREDKPPTSEAPGEASKAQAHMRRDSELVSGRRAGAGWSRSAIRWAPLNVPLQRRLQTCMVLVHTLSIAGSLAIFFLLCTVPLLWPILLPYLLYVLLSRAAVDGKLSFRNDYLRRSRIWSLFASYFPARLHRSQELEPGRKYIFGYHPHGIISHGAFAAFATEALGFSQLFPGITNTLLTLDSNFRVPLYREYALGMGLASVSRESCENILARGGPNGEGMGRAITIVVGGARESLDAKPYTLRLVLKRRKGFVKLAIRTGADLVPVLAFGENDIYDQFDASSHPHVHRAQLFVKKMMGFTIPLFHARGVFNYDVGLMPYRRPINIVVGRPIPIVQSKTPDPAYVDQIHELYVAELVRLWDEWKDTFARYRQGELEVVE